MTGYRLKKSDHHSLSNVLLLGFGHLPDDKPSAGVYMLLGWYVGASKDVKARIIQHFRLLKKGNHPHKLLQERYNAGVQKGFVSAWYLDNDVATEEVYTKGFNIHVSKNARFYIQNYKSRSRTT